MKNENLLRGLNSLGFPLFEAEEIQDANAILADVVKSKDLRFWEGFPVVLANSAEKGLFDYNMVKKRLKAPSDKKALDSLIVMSLVLYRILNLKFSWADKLYKFLSSEKQEYFNELLKKIKKNKDFKITGHVLSSQRLKNTFNIYFKQVQTKLSDLLTMKEEASFEYSLSQIFSSKQKELFLKKLRREKLTKTEREYFSRTVKKKVLALANPELYRLCRKLLQEV